MFDDKVFRGEVRLVSVGGMRVPALVVSSNEYNTRSGHVVVARLSKNWAESNFRVAINVDETDGFIDADNVMRVPERFVGRCVARAPKNLMGAVDDLLEGLFDLGYEDDGKDKEIEELKKEVARLTREVAYGKEGILSRAAEVSKYKKLYDKAVDQIADMTLAADVAKRIAEKTAVVEEEPEPEEPAEEIEPEVVAAVEEMAPVEEEIFEEPKPSKLTFPVWEPPVEKPKAQTPVKKVNVNTATMSELMDLGFSKSAAGRITSHVRKYGPYKKVEDLKGVDDVPSKLIRKLKDVLEV